MRLLESRTVATLGLAGLLALGAWPSALAAPPKATYLFPAGGQRGQTVHVTAAGEFSDWPVEIWSDHPGVAATADKDKGKLLVTIAPDAAPGIAWLRLHNGEGASALQPFMVGALAEVEEKEPNNAPGNPQVVEPRALVNGQLQKNGDADGFKISLKQGETLVAALQANSILGSPVDAVLQIAQVVERRPLADAPPIVEAYALQQDHDAVGLDPRLVFTAPRDGDYLLRVFGFPSEPNSTIAYAGGATYVYRLTLTTGPYVAAALPMTAPHAASAEVRLLGWNLPGDGLRVTLPGATAETDTAIAPPAEPAAASHPEATGFVRLRRSEHPALVAEAGNGPGQSPTVSLPITLSGQLLEHGATHSFTFEAKKGSKLRLDVEASSLGFPWDAHLSVLDAAGQVLVENDDAKKDRDPQIVFTPPADGPYRAVVRDLNRRGGVECVYQLTIEPVTADFALSLATDSFAIAADKPLEIPVTIDRRDGFKEKITVRAFGLPEGVLAEEAISEATGDTSKTVKLVLKTVGDLAATPPGPIGIVGVSADGKLTRRATFDIARPLAGEHNAVWLSISK